MLLVVLSVTLHGCGDTTLRQLSDYGLSQRWEECANANTPTAALAQACDNIQRECRRRAARLGNHIC